MAMFHLIIFFFEADDGNSMEFNSGILIGLATL